MAPIGPTKPQAGVMATKPATAPEAAPSIEGLPLLIHSAKVHATVAAAVAMQDAILGLPPAGGQRMAIRIGLHFGPLVTVDGDVFGDAVNVAARMVAQAKAGGGWRPPASRVESSPR
jgi:class 3 adenylate cyclase